MRRERRQARIVHVISIFLVLFGLLLVRLFSLQLLQGWRLARQAAAQRTDTYVYASGRGQILDRNGLSLHASLQELNRGAAAASKASDPVPVYLQDLVLVEEVRYSAASVATHVTGYIKRPVNPLQPSEGISGLERSFNRELWGTPAAIGVIVDARGQVVPGYGISEWKYEHLRRPYSVVTTIDRKLQAAAEAAGKDAVKKGAFILLDPQSGDILVLASFPRLPVEDLYNGTAGEKLEQMERGQVYLNRALMPYAVGSVFKVVVAAAALAEDASAAFATFFCDGAYELGDRQISCFAGTAHGRIDLQQALVASCNGYFIDLALRLGKEKIIETAGRFKLGQATGIPLGGEEAGNIPAAADLPYSGDVANLAIGQGAITATPLQLARVMSILANRGRDVYPRLVSKVIDKNGNTVRNYPVQYGSLVIAPALAQKLHDMLVTVVEEGTASPARSGRYRAAGKSGTAQLAGKKYSRSWFAGTVETEKETLVAVLLLEEHYAGEPTASAVFRRVMEAVLDAR
ncbi:MAG: penicillin-binding protein 2 [Firmicutes bacterium]|nr:penicillin-binding protein 2 [Bacillota bacterium]